jgi:hypothetical protein
MVAKVMLHIRLGQAGHVYDIFVSLFDIVNDTEVLGINKRELSSIEEHNTIKWRKPDLFDFHDDQIINSFKSMVFDEIQVRQMLFWLVQNSYLCIRTNNTQLWLENMLKFWYRFVREISNLFENENALSELPWKSAWLFSCLQQMIDRLSTLPNFLETVVDDETCSRAQSLKVRNFAEQLVFRYLDSIETLYLSQG